MSPQYGQDTVQFHFTWLPQQDAVERALVDVEAALSPFEARPHWGKVFLADAVAIAALYGACPTSFGWSGNWTRAAHSATTGSRRASSAAHERRWNVSTIVILGSGVMASALAMPLADNGHEVRLVGTHLDREIIDAIRETGMHPGLGRELPETVRPFQLEELETAFADAEIVLSGVNSFGVRWAGERLAPLLQPDQLVIAIAEGRDAGGQGDLRICRRCSPSPFARLRERVRWAAIVGPSIAGEVAARRESCVVFSGREQAALDRTADAFQTNSVPRLDIHGPRRRRGGMSQPPKNCYALGVGLAEGELSGRGRPRA